MFFNETLIETKNSTHSSSLIMKIEKFDRINVGKYKCSVKNSNGIVATEIEIGIRLAPIISTSPKFLSTVYSETPKIKCDVNGAEDEYTLLWKSSHNVLKVITNIGSSSFSDSLQIDYPRIHHEKNITCEIYDNYFRVFDSSQVSVDFPPMFTKGASDNLQTWRVFDIGKSYELDCTTNENPFASSVEWYFYKNKNTTHKKLLPCTEKVYKFDVYNEKMQGNYLCIIRNKYGMAKKNFNVVSRPKEPPYISAKEAVTAKKGETVNLECMCKNCLPIIPSSVYWIKSSSLIKENYWKNEKSLIDDEFKTILKFNNVSTDDAGYYECNMANKLDRASAYIELEVHEAPLSINMQVQGKPSRNKQEINSFTDVEILCSSDGSPEPEFTFYKDDDVLMKGASKIIIQKENIPVASGMYRCIASNYLGTIEKKIKLNYKIPPRFVNKSDVVIAQNENQLINLDCKIEGFPSSSIFWYQNKKLIESYQNNETLNILLSKTSEGKYTCVASNGIGKSLKKDFTVGIKRKHIQESLNLKFKVYLHRNYS